MVLFEHLLKDFSKRFIKLFFCPEDNTLSAGEEQNNDFFLFSNSKMIFTKIKHYPLHFHKIDHQLLC